MGWGRDGVWGGDMGWRFGKDRVRRKGRDVVRSVVEKADNRDALRFNLQQNKQNHIETIKRRHWTWSANYKDTFGYRKESLPRIVLHSASDKSHWDNHREIPLVIARIALGSASDKSHCDNHREIPLVIARIALDSASDKSHWDNHNEIPLVVARIALIQPRINHIETIIMKYLWLSRCLPWILPWINHIETIIRKYLWLLQGLPWILPRLFQLREEYWLHSVGRPIRWLPVPHIPPD